MQYKGVTQRCCPLLLLCSGNNYNKLTGNNTTHLKRRWAHAGPAAINNQALAGDVFCFF